MIDNQKEKEIEITQDGDTELKKYTSFDFKKLWDSFKSLLSIFKNKNISWLFVMFFALVALWVSVFFAVRLYSVAHDLNEKNTLLMTLPTYDTSILSNNRITKEVLDFSSTLYDLVDKNNEIKEDIEKYNDYMSALQLPYTHFLNYLYLPSLNIWKDEYTNKIDTNLIGINFLRKNPYNDVVLLTKRSNFFKNVWDNEFNDVSDISIWNINETEDWYFNIPIEVSFTANSKRSFLMLVDKLSLTSNRENISLINEFFYYLWEEIKKQKKDEIALIVSSYNKEFEADADEDLVIWYHLSHWIFDDSNNVLIDKGVLESTIKSLMFCSTMEIWQCYYEFREKYRDLSTFAYAVSSDVSSDVVADFKSFFSSFPSIISLDDFTFDKTVSTSLTNFDKQIYKGTVKIRVYGKWILADEVSQIALVLWKKCFSEDKNMSVDESIILVDNAIMQQSDASWSDRSKAEDLWDLRDILDSIKGEYDSLSNYKKIIRLFELDRMLDDSGLCE